MDKKPLLHILTVILLLAGASCNQDPEAIIKVDKNMAEIDEIILFTSASNNAGRHDWDFGDGTIAEGQILEHSYSEAGIYEVVLVATSSQNNRTDFASVTIEVLERPSYAKITAVEYLAFDTSAFDQEAINAEEDAEVFLNIVSAGGELLLDGSDQVIEAKVPFGWELGGGVQIPVDTTFYFHLWQQRSGLPDTLIESCGGFPLNNYSQNFPYPEEVTYGCSFSQIKYQLSWRE